MTLSETEFMLVDRWQRGFPIVARPFAVVGKSVNLDESTTINTFARLAANGAISRIGAVVRPHTIGASLLAAMQVPPDRLERVAAIVNAEPLVNHNYQREHAVNLWFVITGPHADGIEDALARIESRTGLETLKLPLLRAYHLDLGFSLAGASSNRPRTGAGTGRYRFDFRDRRLLAAIEDGLPLVERPFGEVARRIKLEEAEVINRLGRLLAMGVVTRFGCVVRHRFFGYTANAMAVWNIPDAGVDRIAEQFAADRRVTLCYQRPRRAPLWPYNLFCMVHAKDRASALAAVHDLNKTAGTAQRPQALLFSMRCFKQRGAMFSDGGRAVH
jgi:DNA-binding Lrp family transcriptional regulator